MLDDLLLRKVRLTVLVDGQSLPFGPNLIVTVENGHASAAHRRKVRREADVARVEYLNQKGHYDLTMANGEIWQVRGCGCGGG